MEKIEGLFDIGNSTCIVGDRKDCAPCCPIDRLQVVLLANINSIVFDRIQKRRDEEWDTKHNVSRETEFERS
jgi:hypothetical protein